MSAERSLKWISVERKKGREEIVVNERVKEEVFGPHGRENCNLISIFGAARQGKSFMMNCLAGKTGLFNISNLSEPCTQGIDISNSMIDLKTFSSIDHGKVFEKGKCKVGFVDAEGQGDQDVTYDANLVCPILLASKCVILNWKDSLQKDKILNHLGIMHKAAINVAMEGGLDDEDAAVFGHLHFVFRDWQYEKSDEKSVFNDIFKEERSAETSAAVRNQIRRSIRESFKSINVWLFPPPVSNASQLRSKLSFEVVEEPFRRKLRELRNVLSSQLKDPMMFGGKPLNGRKLGVLVETVADVLNNGDTVSPQPAWISMSKSEVDNLRQRFELILRDEVDKFLDLLGKEANNCVGHKSSFMAKEEMSSRSSKIVSDFQDAYSSEVEYVVGALEGPLAEEVLAPSQTLVDRIKSDAIARINGGYEASLHKWLTLLIKATQDVTRISLCDLAEMYPLSEDVLEDEMKKRCECIWEESSLRTADSKYGISSSDLESVCQQLAVHSDLLFDQCRQENSKSMKKFEDNVEEIIQASVIAITDEVAKILVSFEAASDTEVLQLKPRLRELDHKFHVEKSNMSAEFRNLVMSMPGKKDKKRSAALLERLQVQGTARLEDECTKMYSQVEAEYLVSAERYYAASVSRCVTQVETESRKLVTSSDDPESEIVSNEVLRENFDELVSNLLSHEEEQGRSWECSKSIVQDHLLTPVTISVEKLYSTLVFLNDQINQSKRILIQKNKEESEKKLKKEQEALKAKATARAKAKAFAAGQRHVEKFEVERRIQEQKVGNERNLEEKKSSSSLRRRQTRLLQRDNEEDVEEEDSDDLSSQKKRRRKTKVIGSVHRKSEVLEKMSHFEGEEMDVAEMTEGDDNEDRDTQNQKRLSVLQQRESARRYAEEHIFNNVKKTKKSSKKSLPNPVEAEHDIDESANEEEEKQTLSKVELAQMKQRELLKQRAKEKADQIRASAPRKKK